MLSGGITPLLTKCFKRRQIRTLNFFHKKRGLKWASVQTYVRREMLSGGRSTADDKMFRQIGTLNSSIKKGLKWALVQTYGFLTYVCSESHWVCLSFRVLGLLVIFTLIPIDDNSNLGQKLARSVIFQKSGFVSSVIQTLGYWLYILNKQHW